jgi:hypothetical protein
MYRPAKRRTDSALGLKSNEQIGQQVSYGLVPASAEYEANAAVMPTLMATAVQKIDIL